MIPHPYVTLALVIGWGASTGWAYVEGRADGRDAVIAQAAREEHIVQVASAAAAASAAEAISRMEVKHVVNRQVLQTQVREVPVYRDCIAPDDSVRRVNASLAGFNGAASEVGVPPADPTK